MDTAAVIGVAARHSSKSNEHYTPSFIVDAARATMTAIDLDPASCEVANRTVRASAIYTQADNGLVLPWHGNVFLNPPGGKLEGQSNQKLRWFKLAAEWMAGSVRSAVFVGFSVEILQTTQTKRPLDLPVPAEVPHCFPSRRVAYMKQAEDGGLVVGDSPPHSSVIVYLPPRGSAADWAAGVEAFGRNFAHVGALCGPMRQEWAPVDA
jgi:hypothetical protein